MTGSSGIRRATAGLVLAAVAWALVPASARAASTAARATLARGPYLQRGSSTAAVIRWRTDQPTDTWLAMGPAPGTWTTIRTQPQYVVDHRVSLAGLAPASRYYYAIGSTSEVLAGGDAEHFFRTAPLFRSAAPVRVWATGDSGLVTPAQAAVRDAYLADAAGAPTDVWLMLGDNAYDSGLDAEYTGRLFAPYRNVLANTFLWPAFGNHDAISSDAATLTGPYFDSFSLPRQGQSGGLPSGSEAWYAFDYGAVHFVALDSSESSLEPGGAMLSWLAADLSASPLPWKVVFFHHPPYTKGSHDSDDPADSAGRMQAMREAALPILEARGADLVLAGHSHSFERSFLLDGHYGHSSTLDPESMILDGGDGSPAGDGAYLKSTAVHGGAVYLVAGSAARLVPAALDHPAMHAGIADYGSVVLDFDGDRVLVRFLDGSGTVRDDFTVVKPGVPLFADGFESGGVRGWAIAP